MFVCTVQTSSPRRHSDVPIDPNWIHFGTFGWVATMTVLRNCYRNVSSVNQLCVYCTLFVWMMTFLMLLVYEQPSAFTHMMADKQQQFGHHFWNMLCYGVCTIYYCMQICTHVCNPECISVYSVLRMYVCICAHVLHFIHLMWHPFAHCSLQLSMSPWSSKRDTV